MAETRPKNYPKLKNYTPTKFMLPTSHYDEEKADRAVRFIENLRHTKGKWAGKRFWLLPWQEQIVRDVFGIVDENGNRQFRTAFVEIGKKNGKSELAAAIALYLLFADNEPSAEVYGAAADRQQASIVFDVANQMVQMTPALMKRCKIMAATKRIVNYGNAGFYQVLSAEVGCVTEDTVIQMADGTVRKASEIKPGDVILASDGQTPVFDEVVSVEIQTPSPVIEVVTHHNRKTTVSENHPFWRMESGRRKQDLTHVYDWHTADTLQKDDRLAVSLGWPSSFIPPEDAISVESAWALGAWAGDGDCTHFRFINPDDAVIEKLRCYLNSIGFDLKSIHSTRQKQAGKDQYQKPIEHLIMGQGKRRVSAGREWVREHFGQECVAKTKRVPEAVWKGGKDVWAAFLAGYLDTDGCVTTKNALSASICSVSEEMKNDCKILLARLGINASDCSQFNLRVSGKPQLRMLWQLLSPYMVHPRKRKRLEEAASQEILCWQRSSESDKVVSLRTLENQKTISFEMRRYQTHVTDGLITHNTKHGLNVSGLVLDEVHAQPNRKLYDVLTKGSGDAREQPLFFLITTAGTDKESICYELHMKALDILNGRKIDHTFYPVVYGLTDDDDWTDEKNWYKANPSLGQTIRIERVREMFQEALDNPAEENVFKQLRLNMWVASLTRFIPEQIYDLGNTPIDMDALKGRDCYGGLDLSSTGDITAFVLIFPPRTEDEKYIVLPFFWIPEDTIPLRVRRASVPYDVWHQQGYLMATEGNVIHYGFIEKFIEELGKQYHILEIAFDRWGATQMVQDLEGMGFTVVPFGQGFKDMSPPTKEFYKLLMEGKIIHGGNPVLRWMAGNVVVDRDPAENIKPTKAKSPEKIDGIVATIMALDRCIRNQGQQGSVYDERPLIVF